MYVNYRITMDSFGDTCPANWEEIADYLNTMIDAEEAAGRLTDDDGEYTIEGREWCANLWERYCAGEIDGAPKPDGIYNGDKDED